jgi:hypothetical protein
VNPRIEQEVISVLELVMHAQRVFGANTAPADPSVVLAVPT